MTTSPTLFAKKLRRWRASNGTHGRMTQEGLAELLDVSVDAIGKYERSLSFIRGDLEHRLAERLDWSHDAILACREDWEARQHRQDGPRYRLLDEAMVDAHFGGCWRAAIRAMIAMADASLGRLPDELAANEDVFLPIYDRYRNFWDAVLDDGEFVAKWSLPCSFPMTRRFSGHVA